MTLKYLETDRLILRSWLPEDLEPMYALNQDPKVMEYFPGLKSFTETQQFINGVNEHFAKYGYGFYVVEPKDKALFIGWVGISHVNFPAHFTPAIEIGWRLAAEYWGKGYATEAARCVLDHAFNHLEIDEIVSFTTDANSRSRHVMEKLKFHHNPKDDFFHPKVEKNNPVCHQVLYRLTKAQWH